jgi:hypothetical protein
MFGQEYPITYCNEAIQIGFRLGKMLELPKIYAIDDDSEMDDSIVKHFNEVQMQQFQKYSEKLIYRGDPNDIKAQYDFKNSSQWSYNNHMLYILINAVNTDKTYNGTDVAAQWYKRNLRIFSNIQALCRDCDKLFVIYGAGHLAILQQLINSCDDMKLIDYDKVI